MHIPVLFKESIDALHIKRDGIYVDGTLGGAGHAAAIAEHLGPDGTLIGFDLDSHAIKRAEEKLATAACTIILVKDNFRNIVRVLAEKGIDHVDGIFLDLGWSSFQIADAGRGLSFQENGPLQMTLNDKPTSEEITAWDIVNTWNESTIADMIYAYGDEVASRKIARAIVQARSQKTIETTFDLVEVILSVLPRKPWMRTHPATKTFQALRIAVNDEYGAVKEVMEAGFEVLKSQGYFAIITFHSGEDRIVKNYFRDLSHAEQALLITKKPITPSDQEISDNPRSRSAQLRIIQKY
jgi:16S rRNA (cytosine1402-N4)-methyltransferase